MPRPRGNARATMMRKPFGIPSFDDDDVEEEKAPLNIDAIINKTRKKTSFSSDKGESEGDRSGGTEARSRKGKSRQTFAGNAVYKNLLQSMANNEDEDNGEDNVEGELDIDDLIAQSRERSGLDASNASFNSSRGSLRSSGRGSKMTVEKNTSSTKLKSAVSEIIVAKRLATVAKASHEAKSTPSPQDDPDLVVPKVVLELWKIVAEGAANHSARNKEIHTALDTAKRYYSTTKEGRKFVDDNLLNIVEILLSHSPSKLSNTRDNLGQSESAMVEKSIRFALQLINDDLRISAHKFTTKCNTLEALERIMDYKTVYFHMSPPAVRIDKILVFQRVKGFYHLAIYLNARANTSSFPEWEVVHRALKSAQEGYISQQSIDAGSDFQTKFGKEIRNMCEGAMKHLKSMKVEALKKEDVFKLDIILLDLKNLFHHFAVTNPAAIGDYCAFQKILIVSLLSTQSQEHVQLGQDMLHTLIEYIHSIRPLVKSFDVYDAGIGFVNGTYDIVSSKIDPEGYVVPGADVIYEKFDDQTGKKIMLFSDESDGDVTWCLSEEHDDVEPGAPPEYTDYYTAFATSKTTPPLDGWDTADRDNDTENDDLYPTLEPLPEMLPVRDVHNLQENLAQWLIEKKIPDIVLGTNLCSSSNQLATSKIVSALEAYTEGSNNVSAKMANLFVSILPSLQTSVAPVTSTPMKSETSSAAAVEAAKARLASALRWQETASRCLKSAQNALMSAKTEHESAKKEADEARKYLASINNNSFNSNVHGESMTSVGFTDDTSTITYDDTRPSKHVNDDDSSITSSEVLLKQKTPMRRGSLY